jgi:hypothetical protein
VTQALVSSEASASWARSKNYAKQESASVNFCNVFSSCLPVAGLRGHPNEQSGAERIQDLLPRGGATLGL